jgi:hypothetical protein
MNLPNRQYLFVALVFTPFNLHAEAGFTKNAISRRNAAKRIIQDRLLTLAYDKVC